MTKILKGLGKIIFSQGLFVILIIIIASVVCYKAKSLQPKETVKTSEVNKK